jgi:uncharacterized protein (DUF58 family)
MTTTTRTTTGGLGHRLLAGWAALTAAATYDFCPWANRYVYWLKRPIGWFVVGDIAGALVGLFLAPQGWFVCGVLTAVMVLGVAWPWISMRGLTATLAFDRRRSREGNTVQLRLAVRNRWPWPAWGLVVERGFFAPAADGEDAPAVVALARVPGWSQNEYEFEFRPPRRGVYPSEPPVLATGFPFGIWQSEKAVPTARSLVVWPHIVPLISVPSAGGDRRTVAGSFVDRAGDDGDIIAARLYRHGDSLRRVHWAQTARRDALVVCERQTTARRRVRMALAGEAFAGAVPGPCDLLDWAVRVLASLCRELHAHHCDVECVLDDQPLVLEPGPAGIRRLFDRLATYEPAAAADSTPGTSLRREQVLSVVITRRRPVAAGVKASKGTRWVVLEDSSRDGPDSVSPAAEPTVRPWISLDAAGDIEEQLQRQWGRLCHDDWRE